MKVPSVVVWLMIALLCGVALASGGDTSQIRWAPDLIAAREASAKFKVPLLIHFYGDGCVPCKTLEQRVFSQPEVIGTLNKFFICTAINANKQPQVASEFAVHSWPTDIFMSPDGEILFRGVCPQDVRTYMGILNNVAVMNRDRNLMLVEKQQASNITLAQQAIAPPGQALTPQRNNTSTRESSENDSVSVPSLGAASKTNTLLPNPELSGRSPTNQHHYYQAPVGQEHQHQLGKGVAGQKSVQNGPLVPSLQPRAITGSTHPSSQPTVAVQRQSLSHPANHPSLANSTENDEFNDKTSAFPPLPGSSITGPHRSAGEMRPNLANMPEMPQLTRSEIDTLPHKELSVGDAFSPTGTRVAGQLASTFKKPSQENTSASSDNDLSQEWTDILEAGVETSAKIKEPADFSFDSEMQNLDENASEDFSRDSSVSSGEIGSTFGGLQPSKEKESIHSVDRETYQPNLDGFCPVALRQQRWVSGSDSFVVRHLGKIYHLSSQEAVEEFLRAPDAYTPVLSGCDPMILLREGKLIDGSTRHGLFEGNSGLVLLFSSAESKSEFQRNFEKNMQALQAVTQRAAGYSASPR